MRIGFKKTDIGEIPADWDVKPLSKLLKFQNGVNASKTSYGRGIPFINVLEPITHSHLYGPEIPGRVTLSESVISTYEVRRGDVLFNRTSETEREIGLAASFVGTERVVFGGFVIRGRPIDQSLDPIYSGYGLRAPAIRTQVIPLGQGAIRANIGQKGLSRVVAPVPSLSEQRLIASALRDVDSLLEGLRRLIAKKLNLKQAAMQQLLTGRKRLPGFRSEWVLGRLGALGRCLRGVSYDGNRDLSSFDNPKTKRLLRANNIQDAVITTDNLQFVDSACVSPEQLVRSGDIVICTANGSRALVGKAGLFSIRDEFEYTFGAFMGCFRTESSKGDPRFVFGLMQTDSYRKQIHNLLAGSSINNLRPSSVEALEFFIPEIAEQSAIAQVLSDFDLEISALEARYNKTRDVKHGMMQELLTGRTRLA